MHQPNLSTHEIRFITPNDSSASKPRTTRKKLLVYKGSKRPNLPMGQLHLSSAFWFVASISWMTTMVSTANAFTSMARKYVFVVKIQPLSSCMSNTRPVTRFSNDFAAYTPSGMSALFIQSSPIFSYQKLFSSSSNNSEKSDAVDGDKVFPSAKNDGCNDEYKLHLAVPTPEDMEDIGAVLSIGTGAGDAILLGGDLGSGKTCLSRGFVRARTGIRDIRVTSPTYLLSNTYVAAEGDISIHHMDLYRLSGKKGDLEPLDMTNVIKKCISIIEWPSRLGDMIPPTRLDINFKIDITGGGEDEQKTRYLTLVAHGKKWQDRLNFLEEGGYLEDLIVDDDLF